MTQPRATYRLQFRQGMTFSRAAALTPYWRSLGVSHLYASPIFTAVNGSTHGYDVTDITALDPVLGGEAGFLSLMAALKAEGLGLILDFVPNHMAASVENPWWCDVLRFGVQSRYARHFDIDWNSGPLTLPFLGKPFEEAVRDGALSIELVEDGHALRYYDIAYPLNAKGSALVKRATDNGASIDGLANDFDFLHQVHDTQYWRLADWRTGRYSLTYRRFFEITGLVGVRVEDAAVFEDVHAKLFELIGQGLIDGIRIDHIDGLADPSAYLRRLRDRVGAAFYIVVEKIREVGERFPPTWPVAGTTGYEFIADLGQLLTASKNVTVLDQAYRDFTGDRTAYETQVAEAKCEIVAHNLEAERRALTAYACAACGVAWPGERWQADALAPAVAAMAASVPVYRTYVDESGPNAVDRAQISNILRRARETEPGHGAALDALEKLLVLDVPDASRPAALAFVTRFQQTTGAVMAKAVEDTVFYRFNRLLALNEVGGDPSQFGGTVEAWHACMMRRQEETPLGLSATASHDTKRGEDARACLYTISEAPELWRSLVERWSRMIRAPAIDRQTQWLLFQALLGVWPLDGTNSHEELATLAGRFACYAEKAVREAKRFTSWTNHNSEYETRVRHFARALFADDNAAFHLDFDQNTVPFIRAGAVNSLVQLLLKLTAPGVPDLYQGTEGWDFSLVDPDNRREPAFDTLAAAAAHAATLSPAEVMAAWNGPAPKMHILTRSLKARREAPDLFASGTYKPLSVTGPAHDHVVAFAREHGKRLAVTVVPRLVFRRVTESGPLKLLPDHFQRTSVDVSYASTEYLRNVLTGETVKAGLIDTAELLCTLPVALLIA